MMAFVTLFLTMNFLVPILSGTPTKLEAESQQLSGGATVTGCSACSGRKAVKLNQGSVTFTIVAGTSGMHFLTISYCASKQGDLIVEVPAFQNPATIHFPWTGAKCKTYNVNVPLTIGSNTVVMRYSSGTAPNVDYVIVQKRNPKKGIIYGNQVTSSAANYFSEYVSWYYRYNPTEPADAVAWAREHNIEFVPMISNFWKSHAGGHTCLFSQILAGKGGSKNCTPADLMETVAANDKSRTYFLQGFNEPWNPDQQSYFSISDSVRLWTEYIQPAAIYSGLKLVSPNVKHENTGVNWLADFLAECCSKVGCNIDLISVIAVHEYQCKDSYWYDRYSPASSKNFYKKLKNRLTLVSSCRTSAQWANYVDSKDIWVTETNCQWGPKLGQPSVTNSDGCKRISRQKTDASGWGLGSLQWMDRDPKITRYAWWTTVINNPSKTMQLVDFTTKQLNPVGRAYRDPYSSTDCSPLGVPVFQVLEHKRKKPVEPSPRTLMIGVASGGTLFLSLVLAVECYLRCEKRKLHQDEEEGTVLIHNKEEAHPLLS